MGRTIKILRRSIFSFVQNYHYFTSAPIFLAFPFAVSTLLSQSIIASSPLFPLVHGRLRSLFLAAGFPPSSELFAILNLKLSQTALTFVFVLPFTLSFLLLAKASIITSLDKSSHRQSSKKHSFFSLFNSLFITQACNSLVILSANATCFCFLVIYFNVFDFMGLSSPRTLLILSAAGAVVYSIILANAYIICNLALVLSGTDKEQGGFISILKTCILIRGRTATALSLAVPLNMALAGVEALFQYRIVRGLNRNIGSSMILESMVIAYMYSMLLVIDTIVGFMLLKSCKRDTYQIDDEDEDIIYFRRRVKL